MPKELISDIYDIDGMQLYDYLVSFLRRNQLYKAMITTLANVVASTGLMITAREPAMMPET